MRSINRGLAVISMMAAVFFAQPAFAGHFQGGTNVVPCGDGEVVYSPIQLWPPNHKMHQISIMYIDSTDPNAKKGDDDNTGEAESLEINSISSDQDSDESQNGEGCGKRTSAQGPDFSFTGGTITGNDPTPIGTSAFVRAERCAKVKQARIYTINVTCTSGKNGNTAPLTITVPHDKRHAEKVD